MGEAKYVSPISVVVGDTESGSVKYNELQDLTDGEKYRARENIGAPAKTNTYTKTEVDNILDGNILGIEVDDDGNVKAAYGTDGSIENVYMDDNGNIFVQETV